MLSANEACYWRILTRMRRANLTTVKVSSFLCYDTVQTGGCIPTFRRKMLPASSGVSGGVRSYSNDGCTVFSRNFGTDVSDSTLYTLLPTVQNSDYSDLCKVCVTVLFVFLTNVQTARLQIQMYVFIIKNFCYFIRYWG
jgi:hypothetical protein